ncbi:LysR family transcriptional regulator [Vibrio breoganii]|uniref:LysR family transcriptional regulator n=1 Tax=Vibrio breoganii TaxID=553239 RepID=UPI000C821F1E|nr:LysR family transcriptional regulator [Vibrio breoganii]PML37983.1 hypothetical protein BCT77_15040 [Vibrio breoganii]
MNPIDWTRIDLNLLKVLKTLGEEQNTSRAAERLFVSQSAISKSLKKLRLVFEDELFARERHGLTPTPYCLDILGQLNEVFQSLDTLLSPSQQFTPETFTKEFKIAVNPMLLTVLSRTLYPRLRALAPHAKFQFIGWSWDTESKLLNGLVDIGINFFPLDISTHIRATPICYADYKICAQKLGTFDRLGVNHSTVASTPLVLLVMPNYANAISIAEQYMAKEDMPVKVLARSDDLHSCLAMVEFEDCGLPVCSLIRNELGDTLTLVDFSAEINVPSFKIASYSSYINARKPITQWLMNEINEVILELDHKTKQFN